MAKIVITGTSRGIGRALVEYFFATGDHQVIGISREIQSPAARGADQPMPWDRYTHFSLEPANPTDFSRLTDYLREKDFRPDVVINNAGMMLNKPFREISASEFDQVMGVNVRIPFMLIQQLLPWMANPGHVLNISSMGGVMGSVKFPGLSVYSASKGALSVLTEALAEELKGSGVSVNALALGSVQTEMLSEAFPGYQAPVSPVEMAAFIGNFALTGHQFFNGKVLPVAVTTP